jgi:hypothetical protein
MAKSKTLLFLSALLVMCLCVAGQASALTFEDVSKGSGADDKGRGKGVAFADIDGDGDHDLFVSNKGQQALPQRQHPGEHQLHGHLRGGR